MTLSSERGGSADRVHNPVLVSFFSEVRRLAEEARCRERAASLQPGTDSAQVEGSR